MEKKILQELKNMTKQLKNISNNTKPKDENELIYDQEDAVKYIKNELREYDLVKSLGNDHTAIIKRILDLEEDYMRKIGIIED